MEHMGDLIRQLRRENAMTQRDLAERLGVSDRAVSKWERNLGCPDVSLLGDLAEILGVDVERLLRGTLPVNRADGGNLRHLRFYVCPVCGNTVMMSGWGNLSCCGRPILPLTPRPMDEAHRLTVTPSDGELYLTFPHPMEKGHHIRFVAHVNWDRVLLVRLYPEQNGELRIAACRGGKFYVCCSRDGLWEL